MFSAKHLAVPLLGAAAVASWTAWLSWESGYHTDAATGAISGPYSWWQVAGCAVTVAALAALAERWLHPTVVAIVIAVAFTVAWSVDAAASDETGLWPVGATLVLVGTALGATAAAWLARLVRRPSAHTDRSLT
jgi:hypothetical protein